MFKRIISCLLVCSLVFSLTGCKKNDKKDSGSASATPDIVVVNEANGGNEATDSSTEKDALDFIGDMNVEREIFDVKLTIPKDYVEGETQESLDAKAKEAGWKSATLNADGSVTYEMTKKQHKVMMDELAENINTELNNMCGSEDYPNYVSITASDNFTNFKVVSKSSELGLTESISVLGFYMFGGMYNVFNGTTVDNIHIDFVNEATGEVFNSADSKDMADN